jgi:glyceraldehyde 3-phosphate dehydrogenase
VRLDCRRREGKDAGLHQRVRTDRAVGAAGLSAWRRTAWPGLEIVGINDIAAPEMCAYLFEFDSVSDPGAASSRGTRARWSSTVGAMPLHRTPDLSSLDLRAPTW